MYDVSPFFVLVHYIVNDIINEIILICICVYPMAVAYFVNTLVKKDSLFRLRSFVGLPPQHGMSVNKLHIKGHFLKMFLY